MSSNTVLISRPAVGAAQILIWSYSCVFLPPTSTAIRTNRFLLWELSMPFYIFHRHRVCLAGHVDLTCTLQLVGRFGSSSLATLSLGFNCGSVSTSTCGSSTCLCSCSCPGGLGFAPVRAKCGGAAAAWVTGVLAASGTRGSWRLGQKEIQRSRKIWQPALANTLQCSCLENPL